MEENRQTLRSIIIAVPLLLIRIYQLVISPMMGKNCRFHPSCSNYAVQSLKSHGLLIGSWLSIKRILRCHPFSQGGYDPVPEKKLPKPKD